MVRRNRTMIKALGYEYEGNNGRDRFVVASLVADTKDEVLSHGTSGKGIKGLQSNDIMQFGSTCLVVTGEFGMINSKNEWVFK